MLRIATLLSCTSLIVIAAPALATTLTFDRTGNCVAADNNCFNFANFSQSYGDVAGVVDLTTRTVTALGSSTSSGGTMQSWDSAYGDLSDIAFGSNNTTLELKFTLSDPNAQFNFASVDIAGWPNLTRATKLGLYALDYTELAVLDPATAPGAGHFTWSPNVSAVGGIIFHFGPESYNAGIDNLTYSLGDVVTPVPEPASWAMMIGGFGIAGGALRNRRRRIAFA